MCVAGLGDIASMMPLAGGVLRRHQAEIAHQLLRVGKSGEVSDLGDQDDSGEEIYSTQTAECRYERLHPPVLALGTQRLGEPIEPRARVSRDGLPIVGKSNVLGGMIKAYLGKIQLAGR